MSAAVAVDSSYVTASSSTLWSRFSPPQILLMGTRVDSVVHGLLQMLALSSKCK